MQKAGPISVKNNNKQQTQQKQKQWIYINNNKAMITCLANTYSSKGSLPNSITE